MRATCILPPRALFYRDTWLAHAVMKVQTMRVFAITCLLLGPSTFTWSAEPADPFRPPAIQAKNVPVVPPEMIERLRQYASIRSAGFAGWAPDGSGILISTRFGDTSQLHRVYAPGGRRKQVTFFNEPTGGRFLAGAKDGALLLTNSRGGSEKGQIYLAVPGQPDVRLTDGASRNLLGPVSRDGKLMVFTSNRRNGRDTDIYVMDPRQPGSQKMIYQTDGEYWVPEDLSLDKSQLAMLRYVSINESYAAVLDLKSGKKTDLPARSKGKVAVDLLKFDQSGEVLLLASDDGHDFRQLYLRDLHGGRVARIGKFSWDVDAMAIDHEHDRVAFALNENGYSKIYLSPEGSGLVELEDNDVAPRLIDSISGIVSSLKFSPDGKQLGFTLSKSNHPSEAYSYSLADKKLTRWTYSETGGLDAGQFAAPRAIQFPTFDERQIPAFYYTPENADSATPVPVVIQIHGGPESQYRPRFSSTTQFLVNELGFAVLAPNVRGSRGYGKSYLLLDNGMKREDSVRDIGSLLDWIEKQPELDASRVAVTGGSYGGYMVLASLVNYPKRIRAGVDVVGIANFITFLERTSAYRRDLRRAEYGDERVPEMRAFFEKINPTSRVDQIESALLVAHGLNDPRVPASESQQIAEKLRARQHTVWTIYAENEGHGFRKQPNRQYVSAVTYLFLKRQLSK